MRDLKSHTEFYLGLYNVLITQDMVRQYGSASMFARDLVTIQSRVSNEGFPFLTNTLPALAKAIDNALVCGRFTPITHFSCVKGTSIPKFLRVLMERVFEQDGSVKIDPCISAVRDLRQILYLLYKYELPHKEEIVNEFLNNFKQVDQSLGWSGDAYLAAYHDSLEHATDRDAATNCSRTTTTARNSSCMPEASDDCTASNNTAERFVRVLHEARALLSELLGPVSLNDIRPAHGPGAVANGQKNWEKMNFSTHYECIHQRFPYYFFFCTNAMDLAANVKAYWRRERVPTGIAKTVLVPKDSRGPRLISMEPTEFQWIQQGIMRKLVPYVEKHRWTRGHVNFTDQTINREHALAGSMSSESVTLDMKEASDRVSVWLVRELFADCQILPDLLATRTEATELPDGEVHLLRKYAPMGSALCFPIMSLVHWALCVSTLHVVDRISIKQAMRAIYVYGDDIIVRGQNHQSLFDTFPLFGLKFNEGKCCAAGIFRESCGMDAVLGQEVTPLKLKKLLPASPYDAVSYVSYITYINRLWDDAYYSSSLYMQDYIEKIFGVIPHVREGSDVPGIIMARATVSNRDRFKTRWHSPRNKRRPSYHVRQWLVPSIRCKQHYAPMDRSEYQRKMLIHSTDFRAGVYVVPRHVKLTLGWSSALV